jgi:hypothetical protein
MGRVFIYKFADYCRQHKIKSCFYQGGDHDKTIYGRPEDQPDEDKISQRYHCEDMDKSDLAFIDTSRFRWFSEYIPVLESTFQNQDLCQKMDVFSADGDHRTFYQLDCPSLGTALMTSVFASHEKLLDSAIGLAMQSLTLNDWNNYLQQWDAQRTAFAERFAGKNGARALADHVHPPDRFENAWSRAPGRPTVLLYEPAIEVIVQKMVTGTSLQDQPFHVDSHHSCYTDAADATRGTEASRQRLNYGAVTMLLPGSDQPGDQVCTEISTLGRDWERNGAGIWLPTNVLHRGRKPAHNRDRQVYLIEVHSNGNFVAQNGVHGHQCKDVKAFRMTLAQLLEIKARPRQASSIPASSIPASSLPRLQASQHMQASQRMHNPTKSNFNFSGPPLDFQKNKYFVNMRL